jgi:hypothetical protein
VEGDVGEYDGAGFERFVKLPWRNESLFIIADVELFKSRLLMIEARSSVV